MFLGICNVQSVHISVFAPRSSGPHTDTTKEVLPHHLPEFNPLRMPAESNYPADPRDLFLRPNESSAAGRRDISKKQCVKAPMLCTAQRYLLCIPGVFSCWIWCRAESARQTCRIFPEVLKSSPAFCVPCSKHSSCHSEPVVDAFVVQTRVDKHRLHCRRHCRVVFAL